MYERFTDRARKVMSLAHRAALELAQQFVGTEHILLGLTEEGHGVACEVLRRLGMDATIIRAEVAKIVLPGVSCATWSDKLPLAPRVERVIAFALDEGKKIGHNYVGTEHLLLGLAREEEGVAARVLGALGVTLDDVREQVLDLLGSCQTPADYVGEQPDLNSLEHLPEFGRRIVAAIDHEIELLHNQIKKFIAESELDRVPGIRLDQEKLRSLRQYLLSQWPKRG